jgi:hypothetical protein
MANQHQPVDLPEILWNSYSSYRTALQTWLVSYGVGVPGLALTNEWIYKRITIPGVAQEIKLYILLFLSGVGLQVVVANNLFERDAAKSAAPSTLSLAGISPRHMVALNALSVAV